MLLQFIVKKVFQQCIIWRSEVVFTKEKVVTDVTLTTDEEKTLRYVAGFIPFALAKQFGKRESKAAKLVKKLIESWREPGDETTKSKSFLDYTKSWTERRNRGGLFCVNDEFYIFIRRIENVARTVLNKQLLKSYKGEDLRDILMEKFYKSTLIDVSWSALYKTVESKELVLFVKHVILRKWIGLRSRAFVNNWVQISKRKAKQSIANKSEPSLRKSLFVSKKKSKV